MPGSDGSRRSRRIASSGRSNGASTGFRTADGHASGRERLTRSTERSDASLGRSSVMADTDAFFTPPPTTCVSRSASASTDGERLADVSERVRDAASREQHRLLPVLPGAAHEATARGAVARAAAVERRPRRTRRAVPAAGDERHDRAAPEPAVSRSAHAARARTAPTTSSARTSRAPCRSAARPCSTRGARSRGCASEGFDRIGILGTSLGSCLALLTTAHEPLIEAQALNHISPYFADVVWRGLSTEHVREGLDGHIDLDSLRDAVETDQPALVSRARSRSAGRCSSTRATTSRFPSICPRIWCASSASVASPTRSPCCGAATTAPGRRRSSSWTAGF